MKYKVNQADDSSKAKSGYKWRYSGTTQDWKATVNAFHDRLAKGWIRSKITGIKITDENGNIVHEELITQ